MAVCQSCSGLRCGGFYTNVFEDRDHPVILATVTPSGHGSVTHSSGSAISAVWDQEGGFKCDQHGVVTKEWSWLPGLTQMEKIVIQVSDQISVKLLSGTSAKLCFRCTNHRAELPLPVVSSAVQAETRPNVTFSSDAARDPKPKQRPPSVDPKTKKEVLQEFKDAEEPEQLEQWRQGGHAARKVKMLQQRVRNILEDWLEFYRRATGIKCPNLIRMPDAQLRNQVRKAVQSADLSSLCPPEHFDVKTVQPREDKELTRLEIMPEGPPLQSSAVPPLFKLPPSCLACPVLLRAALQGEGGCRRCGCSATAMPVVTDLEYDALVTRQPPQSHQILVVCVTPPCQPVSTSSKVDLDVLNQLYRRMNSHRTAPCTQCQLDSFRLLRYEMPVEFARRDLEDSLLHRRHHAAPGMFLMYIRGKLLFLGFVFGPHSRTEKDLLKEISRVRGDYRLGLSLPSDHRYSGAVSVSAATDPHSTHKTKESAPDPEVPEVSKDLEGSEGSEVTEVLEVPEDLEVTKYQLPSETETSLEASFQVAESQPDLQ